MKSALKSKTIQGILITLLPVVFKMLNLHLVDSEGLATEIITLVGASWAIYGRFKATDRIIIK